MVHTFSAVSRDAWGRRWSAVLFTLMTGIAGSAVGFLASLVGNAVTRTIPIMPTSRLALVIVVVAAITSSTELGWTHIHFPQRDRQVPSAWRARFGRSTTAAAYGLLLGGAVLTRIPYATTYFFLVVAAVSGTTIGIMLGMLYGISRGLASALPSMLIEGELVPEVTEQLMRLGPAVRYANGTYLATIAFGMVTLLLTNA